jgi:hypothetical protein
MKPKLLLLPECMIYGAAREEREGIMDLVMCVVSLLLRKRMGARRSERGVIRYAAGALLPRIQVRDGSSKLRRSEDIADVELKHPHSII